MRADRSGRFRRRPGWAPPPAFLLPVLLLLLLPPPEVLGQESGDYGGDVDATAATVNPFLAQLIYSRLLNMSDNLPPSVTKKLDFCITDIKKEVDIAFNFSSDLTFMNNCLKETGGDLMGRLCTAAEIMFYFSSFLDNGGEKLFLRPNKNCNLSSWQPGCEPGWACSVGGNEKVNLKETKNVPDRTQNCRSCCEGFFCPQGITCMIPDPLLTGEGLDGDDVKSTCPLGAYCPLAKLNKTTGVCDPYNYQLPPGQGNHSCGGADIWADVGHSGDMFCPAGYYCPSTIERISCSRGHYCRMGSTSQERCIQKGSCKPNSAKQDITVYGALLMVALSLVLLIIYNFSGQLLTNRERKQAKSRETAARMARETAQARERWKSAKDVARKHVVGFQSQLSRTFSRKSKKQSDLKGIGRFRVDDAQKQANSTAPEQSSAASSSKEPSSLTKMMRSLEENPEGFNQEIGGKNIKKNMPRGTQMNTWSQMFNYAYGQLEKEKALQQENKNLTFSGVIAMATDNDIRSRPLLEVTFKDLTLTLKGNKKRLLRSVTGKLMPGRIAALMGPSGAGKTTFLNALAGKATGCEISGLVLINGKIEPIRAYKKIIGFVPQDDIVHGNLTVEENLWFSARCRLSADMPKADKVLVVERVIEALGLQPIRDSLVGTVEERGISGGQRKRVNVGLEMVMEPSLLILDEPTSGLDSSSSQLLLRALRREAREGVNICVVVHQPSYALFKMFDDLILLAKGGITVYHGPVKKVEEYFAGLGINVPERINPPDYFIDILEGIVKPPAINVKELPLFWMLHNGYDIPPDMQKLLGGEDSAKSGETSAGDGPGKSIAGEVWGNIKDAFELKKDHFKNDFSKSNDLSNRITPGVFQQYKYFLGRVGKQRLREARILGVDYLILGLAGACLGTLAKVGDETFGALGYTYTVIAVSLLCKIGALRSFSLEKLLYLRERASGMSSLAYFLSRDTIDHFNTVIKPIVYLSMFYFFNNPRSSIIDNYTVLIALVYCVTGIGYAFAIFFQPGSAQLWSALLPVVLTLIATQPNNSKWLKNLCYTKWALEAFVIANAKRYSGVWLITRCGALMKNHYDISDWTLCIVILVVFGVVFRFIAFFCMVICNRK